MRGDRKAHAWLHRMLDSGDYSIAKAFLQLADGRAHEVDPSAMSPLDKHILDITRSMAAGETRVLFAAVPPWEVPEPELNVIELGLKGLWRARRVPRMTRAPSPRNLSHWSAVAARRSRRLCACACQASAACTDSKLVAGAVTCDLAGGAGCDKIAVCVPSPALPHHHPGLWLAGAARPWPGVQGCGDHGALS
jgi:hypothetical protein